MKMEIGIWNVWHRRKADGQTDLSKICVVIIITEVVFYLTTATVVVVLKWSLIPSFVNGLLSPFFRLIKSCSVNLTYPKMKNGARSVKACLYQNLTASNTVRLAANRYGAGKPPRVCERCDAKTIHKGLGISQQAKIPVLHFCKTGIFTGSGYLFPMLAPYLSAISFYLERKGMEKIYYPW